MAIEQTTDIFSFPWLVQHLKGNATGHCILTLCQSFNHSFRRASMQDSRHCRVVVLRSICYGWSHNKVKWTQHSTVWLIWNKLPTLSTKTTFLNWWCFAKEATYPLMPWNSPSALIFLRILEVPRCGRVITTFLVYKVSLGTSWKEDQYCWNNWPIWHWMFSWRNQ